MKSPDAARSWQKKTNILQSLARYHLALPFSERRMLLFVGDLCVLYLAGLLTIWGRSLIQDEFTPIFLITQGQAAWLLPLAAIWIILAAVNECYDLKIAGQPRQIMQGILITSAVVSLIYLLAFFVLGRPVAESGPPLLARQSILISPLYNLPRIIPISFLIVSLLLVSVWRIGYIQLSIRFPLRRRAIIVGAGQAGRVVVEALQQTIESYEVVGFVDDDPAKLGEVIDGIPVLGNRHDLVRQVRQHGINEIILAITHEVHGDLFTAMMDCYEQGIVIKPMSVLYEDTLGRIPVEHLGQQSLLIPFSSDISLPTLYRVSKRLVDILFALFGLALLAILLPFIALAIVIDSAGPIFYIQERLGKGGRRFLLYKFRSMRPNAEQEGLAVWARPDDPRVTRVGRFLRRTRLDEVPQLYNVLKGELSLVGPRPERPEFVAQLQKEIPFYRARLSVKPGLTGWAQIQHGYSHTVEDALVKLQYDLYYVKHRSIILDLLIILRTIKVVLMFRGV